MRRIYAFGLFIYPYDRQHGVSLLSLSLSLHCVRYQIEFNSIFRLRNNAISNNARHPKTKTKIASAVATEKRQQRPLRNSDIYPIIQHCVSRDSMKSFFASFWLHTLYILFCVVWLVYGVKHTITALFIPSEKRPKIFAVAREKEDSNRRSKKTTKLTRNACACVSICLDLCALYGMFVQICTAQHRITFHSVLILSSY